MELYQLKTFVAVAEERHLTRAAERVFTSPPAVSAQIKALEDELGVRLFDRSPRGMLLTEAGSRLMEEAERTLASAHRLRTAAAQLRGSAQGVVRFGTVSDPVSLRLGQALVTLAERHPQVTLQLHQGLSAQTLASVQRGELDCAYVMADRESIEGLELQRLSAVDLVVALPTALAEAHPDATLEELVGLPWVGTGPGCVMRSHLEALFASARREYREAALANTEGAVRSMVASGFGAGIVRLDQAEQAERQGELKIWRGWRAHTWLCWAALPAAQQSSAVAAVKQALLEAWG
ncbi:LysR family transcriptional regulator [Ideonella sp. YS5]|uniref:LysR family transcriptional regulator n=1 Tax=Ideonella sp. YS5 TaxID=3453714 RepID=UPI003EE85D4A